MVSEGSVPCSQQPATCQTNPVQSSPVQSRPIQSMPSYRSGFSSVFLLSFHLRPGFSIKTLCVFFFRERAISSAVPITRSFTALSSPVPRPSQHSTGPRLFLSAVYKVQSNIQNHCDGFCCIWSGNEPGYRLPRGTATFLDQEEGSRIRRQMLGDRGFAGFYGGSSSERRRYDSYDGGDRYGGNEIDRDVYFDKRSRDYYPNYNPDGGSRNTWAQDCFPRGEPYDNNGISSYNSARSGYINHRGYDDNRHGIYNRNKVRGFEGHSRGYQQRYDTNSGGFVDMWGKGGYYGSSDKDDTVREGTVGFYGRSRRQ